MFELDGVVKTFAQGDAEIHAVDGISLRINSGEFVVIEGPSGSGKSTLLQLLGGLDRPTAGVISFEGNDMAAMGDASLAKLRLRAFGFVFQQFNLIPTLTAAENVESALAPLGARRKARRDRALALLGGVGLRDRADHLPSQLSGGEQQRVAIARALSKSPRVILADEPTGNLDSRTGQEIMTILRRLSAEVGQTVLVITHDPGIAAKAPRLVRMRDGRVVADGTGAALSTAATAPPLPSTERIVVRDPEPPPPPPAAPAISAAPPAAARWIETTAVARPATPVILHAEGVTKHYVTATEEVIGLEGISLEVHEGEFVAITGPSGSGKTTLLNCLSGLDRIDHGRVLVAGQAVHTLNDREQSRLRARTMGFIFQTWNLVPVFSSVENVELPLLLGGASNKVARERASATLERVGLAHRLNHRPNELSGGEQQRVAIARALTAGPKLVWADEPTGNLDSHTAQSVMRLLGDLNRDGLTVVVVTHDEAIAETASRRIRMSDGRLVGDHTRTGKPSAGPSPSPRPQGAPSPPTTRAVPAPPSPAHALPKMTKAERREAKRRARMTAPAPPLPDADNGARAVPPLPSPARVEPDSGPQPINYDNPLT